MKKIVSILLICCCILLTSCTMGNKVGKQETESEKQYPEVVDKSGISRQLKLGDVDVEDMSVTMQHILNYSQISDGHYYYIQVGSSGKYTIYRDKREKVVCFEIKNGEVGRIAKYGEKFYAYTGTSDKHELVGIDAGTGEVEFLKDLTVDNSKETLSQMIIYKDLVHYEVTPDPIIPIFTEMAYSKGKLARFCLDDKIEEKQFSLPTRMEAMSYIPALTIVDGKMYYGAAEGKKVTVLSYDLEKGVEEEVLYYERNDNLLDAEHIAVHIEMDKDYIYCQDYIIPWKGGKMERVLKDSEGWNYSANSKYIFYADKAKRVRRINKDTLEDTVICDDIKIEEVDCTEEGIYVKEPNRDGSSYDPVSYNLYYMDCDGKNREEIWRNFKN